MPLTNALKGLMSASSNMKWNDFSFDNSSKTSFNMIVHSKFRGAKSSLHIQA